MVEDRLQISDHQQSVAAAPSKGLPHTPSSTGGQGTRFYGINPSTGSGSIDNHHP